MEPLLEQIRSQPEALTAAEGDSVLRPWRKLQTLADTLGQAEGTEATVAAILAQVQPATGAQVAALALLAAHGQDFTVRRVPEGPVAVYDRAEASEELRRGEPLFLTASPRPSPPFPAGALWSGLLGSPVAAAILPLRVGPRVLGALGLAAPHDFDEAERAFLLLVAHECAQALERARLSESEHDFRAMFELASSGKVQADPATWRFVRVNRKFCEITGYTEAELLERTFLDITHPDDRGLSAGNFRHALDHGENGWQSEKRYLRKDGTLRWVVVTGSVVRDATGRPTRSLAVIHDITERKQAEEALRASEERLRLAQQAGNIGTWDWDLVTGEVSWSEGIWHLLGLTPGIEGARESAEQWVEHIHPEDRERATARIQALLATGDDYYDEFRIVQRDGGVRWLAAKGRFKRDAGGRPTRLLGVNIDITERKLAEVALQEADRRKDEFLAMLGHELRNPLMPVRNALAILQNAGPCADPEMQERLHRIIDRQVRHMVRLVDDLLDVSRIQRGKIELRRQHIDVIETVRQAVEACQELVRAKQHELVLDLPEGPLAMEADPTRLEQVICNLLNNAAKYTEPQGRIAVQVRREAAEVVLRIRDNGTGLSAESRERIFDLFVQADHAIDRSEGGLGIGLTLVRQLVEMHGGTVAAFSEGPGRGSEFVVKLPLGRMAAAPLEPSQVVAPAESPTPLSKSVLLIEDNEDIRTTLGVLLELEGHRVSLARDGEEGLECLLTESPDVALVDVGLPGIDGYELARRARQQLGPGVVLIAVTGYGQAEDRRLALAAGFDLHMTKPVDPDELRRVLSQIPVRPAPACLSPS